MKVYGVIGWRNAGKTSLMERLVAEITGRGLSVSTVKHVHHDVDLDQPGKDTYRHRVAGAREVVLAGAHRHAILTEHRDGAEPALADILRRLAPVDLVLVEGYKRDTHPKVEVWRPETGHDLIQRGDPNVRAVATDVNLPGLTVPVLDLNDTAAVADFILHETGLQTAPSAMFDTVVVVDWSAAAKVRKPSPDSIWVGTTSRDTTDVQHFATRIAAEAWLAGRIVLAQDRKERLLIGVDFAFGFPAGVAQSLTGKADVRAVWEWFEEQIKDSPDGTNNRFVVAAKANRQLGRNVFWGAPVGSDLTLKRQNGSLEALGLAANREVERKEWAAGAKSIWQLTGAGAVGSQSLVGLPMIHRLSRIPSVTVWPFEAPGQICIAEVYPSLLKVQVDEEVARGWMRDAAQVRLLSVALWKLGQRGQLAPLFSAPHSSALEEGWILGAGHEAALKGALR